MTRLPAVAALVFPAALLAASAPITTITLAPYEKTTVTIDATVDTVVGFTNLGSVDEAKRCRNTCIRMAVPGNIYQDVRAAIGTSMPITPKNGKIEVIFENVETFPISIEIFRE